MPQPLLQPNLPSIFTLPPGARRPGLFCPADLPLLHISHPWNHTVRVSPPASAQPGAWVIRRVGAPITALRCLTRERAHSAARTPHSYVHSPADGRAGCSQGLATTSRGRYEHSHPSFAIRSSCSGAHAQEGWRGCQGFSKAAFPLQDEGSRVCVPTHARCPAAVATAQAARHGLLLSALP